MITVDSVDYIAESELDSVGDLQPVKLDRAWRDVVEPT